MRPGAIFLHKDFAFQNGGKADKFFVVLGEEGGILVAAKTTSKGLRYRNEHGCQAGSYFAAFMLTKGCCVLPLDTWVCLSEFYEFKLDDLTSRLIGGDVFAHGSLDAELTLDVQFCAVGCDDISHAQEKVVRDCIGKLKIELAKRGGSFIEAPVEPLDSSPPVVKTASPSTPQPSPGDFADLDQ